MKAKNLTRKLLPPESNELDENFLKKAALAGLLGLTFYAGMELTSSKNTPLGKAMQAAAEQGDDYAAYHLERLDLYADAGAGKIMTKLSNKYLEPYKNRRMNETRKKKSKLHEDVIDRLRYIVDNNQIMRVTFDNGEVLEVDLFTASAIVNLHNAVNDQNKRKIEDKISKNKDWFMKIADFAFSSSGKPGINESTTGDWDVDAIFVRGDDIVAESKPRRTRKSRVKENFGSFVDADDAEEKDLEETHKRRLEYFRTKFSDSVILPLNTAIVNFQRLRRDLLPGMIQFKDLAFLDKEQVRLLEETYVEMSNLHDKLYDSSLNNFNTRNEE